MRSPVAVFAFDMWILVSGRLNWRNVKLVHVKRTLDFTW